MVDGLWAWRSRRNRLVRTALMLLILLPNDRQEAGDCMVEVTALTLAVVSPLGRNIALPLNCILPKEHYCPAQPFAVKTPDVHAIASAPSTPTTNCK